MERYDSPMLIDIGNQPSCPTENQMMSRNEWESYEYSSGVWNTA